MPWFIWSRRGDPASVLRRRILEIKWGAPLVKVSFGARCVAAALHVTRVMRELLLCWRRTSIACKAGFGISRSRQLGLMFWAVYRYNFPPSLFYRARLFRVPLKRWISVFSHGEAVVPQLILKSRTMDLDVWSKLGWQRFCTRHGFPVVPVFCRVVGGRVVREAGAELPAGGDLFVKPDLGWGSRGVLMLQWQEERAGWLTTGACECFVGQGDIESFLINLCAEVELIVQPRMRTHSDLVDLSACALANVRVLTMRGADGGLSVFSATLRIPWGDEHSSDVAEGFYVPVNSADGTLGYAEQLEMSRGLIAVHPQTGVRIRGRVISQWGEMKRLALEAHALLPEVPCVGWDLVPTESGVLILEANVCWSTNLAQVRGLALLGESSWPATMLAYFDKVAPGGIPDFVHETEPQWIRAAP